MGKAEAVPPRSPPTPQDYSEMLQVLQAWDLASRRRKMQAGLRLTRRQIEVIQAGLKDALEYGSLLPSLLSLRTRFSRARVAMRGKTGRARLDAFAREMGVVSPGGVRPANLARDEADLFVVRYWELTCTDRLVLHWDELSLWASGFKEQVSKRPRRSRIEPTSPPVCFGRPIVQAPIPPIEAVKVIADWFSWRFGGDLQSVRLFLERERHRLPDDQARLASLPAPDFRIPSSFQRLYRQRVVAEHAILTASGSVTTVTTRWTCSDGLPTLPSARGRQRHALRPSARTAGAERRAAPGAGRDAQGHGGVAGGDGGRAPPVPV